MSTFLDTNVLIYLTQPASPFYGWATEELAACKLNGPAIVTDMVYCEFSIGLDSVADVDQVISGLALERYPTSDAALFRAGRAFKKFKKDNAGIKTNVLPDFIIGAIAEEVGAPLVTANPGDFLGYFPGIKLITPP